MELSLEKFGLSPAESRIYLAVLKRGKATVREIAKDSGYQRPNIYDVLEQLKEKSLMSEVHEGRSAVFTAAPPDVIREQLAERQRAFAAVEDSLSVMHRALTSGVSVEVYKGTEGMKTLFNDILRSGKDLFGFGVRGQLREALPEYAEYWLREMPKRGGKYRAIYTSRTSVPPWYTEIRYEPSEFKSPAATFIYGDVVAINLWQPELVVVLIRSPAIAQTYKQHFNFLWKNAER